MILSQHVGGSGWLVLSLCLLVSLFNIASAQNCKTVAPCTDPDSVARFAAYSNATLLADARQECGATLEGISEAELNEHVVAFIIQNRRKGASGHGTLQLKATAAKPWMSYFIQFQCPPARHTHQLEVYQWRVDNFAVTHGFRTVEADVLVQMLGPCFDELDVRPGCECNTRACKAAIQPLVTQTCKRAVLKVICDVADWLEPQLAANVRSMYLHVFNDCALGAGEGCTADNFDESLCLGLPAEAPAPAPAPIVSIGPRCNENLTALFNSGPGPAPGQPQEPDIAPSILPEPAPMVNVSQSPAPAPAEPAPAPTQMAAPQEDPEVPVEAEAPDQPTRDGGGEPPVAPVSDPEAASATHLPGGVLSFVCAVIAGLMWG